MTAVDDERLLLTGPATDRTTDRTAPAGEAGWPAHRQLEQFVVREARLLDEGRLEEWLELFTPDAHYSMPNTEYRYRGTEPSIYDPARMAHFDDTVEDLGRRVQRFSSPHAWAEDPPTRHVHLIGSIEIDPPGEGSFWRVRSAFISVRGRSGRDEDWLAGRRDDLLEASGPQAPGAPLGRLHIHRRVVTLTQSTLLAKNLNVFL
ncbi:MAG: 3-phenylpropionate/cinnamic acid dioxygenase subunit beta [Actinomycetia bacterium]|nr:3-phenylpropionate/cinnamic acid dioxygenase subunit beta [Actinomycetes bacterium]